MTQQEAKEKLRQAESLCAVRRFEEAWPILEAVHEQYPTSRSVTYQRALCLAGLGRFDEADDLSRELEGKIDAGQLAALRDALSVKRAEGPRGDDLPVAQPIEDAVSIPPQADMSVPEGASVFVVESVFPASAEETTVTGHVASGVFHSGDRVSLTSSGGLPLLVPIERIGTAETPIKMVRHGQSATMLLQVEPHHVVTGAQLIADDSSESNAETMVVSDTGGIPGGTKANEAPDPALDPIEKLLNERNIVEARSLLEGYLKTHSSSCLAYRLLARSYLEADDEFRDLDKALGSIKRAYELGGAEDRGVLETLAAVMAAKGEAEHGLRFLEKVYAMSQDDAGRDAVAKRVVSYRERYDLGHLYEFVDSYGDVFFESSDLDAIGKAVEKGAIPEDCRCRRDRVGDWQTLRECFGAEHPEVLAPLKAPQKSLLPVCFVGGVLGFLAGAVLAAVLWGATSNLLAVGGVVGALVVIIGVVLHDLMAKKPVEPSLSKTQLKR